MIDTITINNKTMGVGYQTHILSINGLASPLVENSLYRLSGQHGARIPRSYWRERSISLELLITGNTTALYKAERLAILQAFGLPTVGASTITFTGCDAGVVTTDVQLVSIDGPYDTKSRSGGVLRVELVSQSPYLVSSSVTNTTIYLSSGSGAAIPTVIPLSLAYTSGGHEIINNTGNGLYYPLIVITGPVENPIIKNYTTGLQLQVEEVLSGSDILTIDMQNQTVLLNNNYNYLDYTDGDFWYIQPGNNEIGLSSAIYDINANAVVTWKSSYIGV